MSAILVTSELDHPLQILKIYLEFLHRGLADTVFRRITRNVIKALQELLFNDLLLRQDFTLLGSIRFSQDVSAIQSLINCLMPSTSRILLDMPKLREGVLLLSLPQTACEGTDSYWEVSKSVYSNKNEAARTLSRLGIFHLSNTDARMILSRRIDESLVEQNSEN